MGWDKTLVYPNSEVSPYENNNLKDERKDVVLDMEKQIQDIIGDHKI